MPAAGKTTLARALSEELRVPLVAKDDIKEQLYDALGIGDLEWSRRLGRASFALIFAFCQELLAVGQPVIAEANFFAGLDEPRFADLPSHRLVQVHCTAPLDVLLTRYEGRPNRHAGHLDGLLVQEMRQRFQDDTHGPLALAGQLIEVDTSKAVEVQVIANRVRDSL